MPRHLLVTTLIEGPIRLLDLDAAGMDLTQPPPAEFMAFLDEQTQTEYLTLWSTQLDENGFDQIWRWLSAADDARHNPFRMKIQFVQPPAEFKPTGGNVTELTWPPAPSFVGVLTLVDLSGSLFAYGNRAMRPEMLGMPVYRLVRDSDNAEMDVLADAVTGEVDAAAVTAWAGGVCRLHTWYDQTGVDSHLTDQGGGFVKAPWVADVGNGKPGFRQGTGLGSQPNIYAPGVDYFCNVPGGAGGQGTCFMLVRGPILLNCRNNSGARYFNMRGGAMAMTDCSSDSGDMTGAGGDYTGLVPNTAFALLDASVVFGDNSFFYNGTRLANNNTNDIGAVGAGTGEQPRLSWTSSTTNYGIQEFFLCPGVIDADQRLAARQNMAAWAGITLPT